MSRRLSEKSAQAMAAFAAAREGDEPEEARRVRRSVLQTYFLEAPTRTRGADDELQVEPQSIAGALPTMSLDPTSIAHSAWSNRHASSFDSAEYSALKEEIRSAGGNIQAIKVRPIRRSLPCPLPGSTLKSQSQQVYELVYGHRRHRACLELGLPVLALVQDVPDAELFVQMDRENRNRENLSPWEQGRMYLKALEAGLFPSMRQLATAVGCDPGTVSRAISLAALPQEIIQAFSAPTDLQYRWAKPLADALAKNRKSVLRRAEQLSVRPEGLSPPAILAALLGIPPNPQPAQERGLATLCHGGKRIGEVTRDAHQRTVVQFHRALTVPEQSEVVQAIQKVFKKR
jgi:ParB family transcriptional regulator, chromosome partitioning protein